MSASSSLEKKTCQRSENDVAKEVVICYPAPSKKIGMLHPISSLYEKPIGTQRTKQCMLALREMLEGFGVECIDVCDALAASSELDQDVKARLDLEDLASRALTYAIGVVEEEQVQKERGGVQGQASAAASESVPAAENNVVAISESDSRRLANQKGKEGNFSSGSLSTLMAAKLSASESDRLHSERLNYYVSEEYKRTVLAELSTKQLVEVVLTRPTVTIRQSSRDTGFMADYSFEPLSNLLFTRDQQITTQRGIVMGRLASRQRAPEVDVMDFVFRKLGYHVAGRVPSLAGMTLEGGDYIPMGRTAFIGVGLRTSLAAVMWLLNNDLIGAERVAVVFDNFERSQERMHLDCVFNVCSARTCVMLQDMMGSESPTRRVVSEWVRQPDCSYEPGVKEVEFSEYVRTHHNLSIIPVSSQEQLEYGCNCLNLGDGRVIAVQQAVARRIAQHPDFDGTVAYLKFDGVTALFGAVHCATQVLRRDFEEEDDDSENDD